MSRSVYVGGVIVAAIAIFSVVAPTPSRTVFAQQTSGSSLPGSGHSGGPKDKSGKEHEQLCKSLKRDYDACVRSKKSDVNGCAAIAEQIVANACS